MKTAVQFDSVVIGGGPAGLSAALALTRYRHRSLVVEAPTAPRNAASRGMHGMLGLEGLDPVEFRERAWRELIGYGMATLRTATAEDVVLTADGTFRVHLDDGTSVQALTVLLATGVLDLYPEEVDGFAECWGRSVIHCPFCLGWENADRPWGVIADTAEYAAVAAIGFRSWTADVISITPPGMPFADKAREAARLAGGSLREGVITRLHHNDGMLHTVEFSDGTSLDRETLLWTPRQRPVPLVARLIDAFGLEVDQDGFVTADKMQRTGVPSLHVAGDLTTRLEQSAVAAAAAGAAAADSIHLAVVQSAATR